ncbi:transposase [Desulfococcaceae bacterium HSG9]|nr:transposase [Desulfococcaceae bacterium HSG9]
MKGRKRHIPVDTLGLTVAAVVTPANEGERKGLKVLLEDYFEKGVTRFRKIWVDAGYSGVAIREQVRKLKKTHQIDLEVNENKGKGFNVIKKDRSWREHQHGHSIFGEIRKTMKRRR